MSSRSEQKRQITESRNYGRSLFDRQLATWTTNVIAEWSPGTLIVPQEAETELIVILRNAYNAISQKALNGIDYRPYKQDDEDPFDEAMRVIAIALAAEFALRVPAAGRSIIRTLQTMMGRSSEAAEEAEPAERTRVARSALGNYMRNHRIIIAVTESNWTVNTTRSTAILAVKDPLHNSVERIAALIEAGDENGARRLAREVLRLARLPNSVSEGTLLGYINDNRDRLVTPEAQGRIIATMRNQADKLDSQEKQWRATFRNTRPSHAEAHGQTRPIDKPFEVGGALLQYPMDASLGAPLDEIVNCECETLYL